MKNFVNDMRRFRNRLCILHSLDPHEIPNLSPKQHQKLLDNPLRGYLELDDKAEEYVFNRIRQREDPNP